MGIEQRALGAGWRGQGQGGDRERTRRVPRHGSPPVKRGPGAGGTPPQGKPLAQSRSCPIVRVVGSGRCGSVPRPRQGSAIRLLEGHCVLCLGVKGALMDPNLAASGRAGPNVPGLQGRSCPGRSRMWRGLAWAWGALGSGCKKWVPQAGATRVLQVAIVGELGKLHWWRLVSWEPEQRFSRRVRRTLMPPPHRHHSPTGTLRQSAPR